MQRNTDERKKKQLEFKMWATVKLMQHGLTRAALAEKLGVPASRISEAINGTGFCVKYIPKIIEFFDGNEEDFVGLYDISKKE